MLRVLMVPRVLTVLVLRVPRVLMVLVPKVLVPTVLVLMVLGAKGAAQAPGEQAGIITGQVVDAATGRPVSAAIVSLSTAKIEGNPILTGADGRFAFQVSRQDSSYLLTARKGGYAEGATGRLRPGGPVQRVQLSAVTPNAAVTIRMWKLGAITGTMIDEAGEPVVGLQVRAMLRSRDSGQQRFIPIASGAPAVTDDRGVYRLSSLAPGEYVVLTSPPSISFKKTRFEDIARTGRASGEMGLMLGGPATPYLESGDAWMALPRGTPTPPPPVNGRLQIYPTTFYPSATSFAQASIVTLGSGEERASVDIQLTPVPTARVSGMLIGPSGPAPNAMVRLIPAGSDELPVEMMAPTSNTDASGAFAFAAVPSGQYVLRARGTVPGSGVADSTWVDLPLPVSGEDMEDVVATLSPGLRLRARTQFEGNSPPPAPPASGRFTSLPFMLEPVANGPASMSISAVLSDAGVIVAGYPPGRYRVRVANSPQGWMFKGAILNGVDVSETPFDLTRDIDDLVLMFTDRWSGMSGAVQGAAADAAAILVFPTDADAWTSAGPNSRRFRSARADAGGQFGIGSLPPGDYYLIAVREQDAGDWRDPAKLEALARIATRVTVMEGEHKTLGLQVREVPR